MNDSSNYAPPKVWVWNKANGGRFANINRPVAGPTHDKELPVGISEIRLRFEIDSDASDEQLASLLKLTERYCVIFQTLKTPPRLSATVQRTA